MRWWQGDEMVLHSSLSEDALLDFFISQYRPTPIVAPWNGGSGFYEKEDKKSKDPMGVELIEASLDNRFACYRHCISIVRSLPAVRSGKAKVTKDEDERRQEILLACRNLFPDEAVEWLDAAVGISADGSRSFAPVLGTGGNEGNMEYTNNFMLRLAEMLITPDKKTPVLELLSNTLFGTPTAGFRDAAIGQYDPGRAGGANQGQGTKHTGRINPWDQVLTLEGAVSWASGLYRRHGISYRTVLCSPFTVGPTKVGYGSASDGDAVRAEIWSPLWQQRASYQEIKVLLREGRASINGFPATTGLQFAESASSLGVDRGIDRFVRYVLLERRGQGYFVAVPIGVFSPGYRLASDLVRELRGFLEQVEARSLPPGCEGLRRSIDSALFDALLFEDRERMGAVMRALGRLLRRLATTGRFKLSVSRLDATRYIEACGTDIPEVRIAGALGSSWDILENLSANHKNFAWSGRTLSDRLISVQERRLQQAAAARSEDNPYGSAYRLNAGDATLYIEGSVDDDLIEDLLFAFAFLNWKGFGTPPKARAEVMPIYTVLKHLFLPDPIKVNGENKRLISDPTILSLLQANNIKAAAKRAVDRLRIAGLRPLDVTYAGGVDAHRLAAALLIPIYAGLYFGSEILHDAAEQAHA